MSDTEVSELSPAESSRLLEGSIGLDAREARPAKSDPRVKKSRAGRVEKAGSTRAGARALSEDPRLRSHEPNPYGLGERPMGVAFESGYVGLLDRELPRPVPREAGMRVASFFCCAGGIDLGFSAAGFRLSFANDISPEAAASYAHNLGHAPVVRDIRQVPSSEVPEVDVLTGGFPCVTFSTAGKRLGVTDDLHGKLYLELCRVIGECRPKYFVAENVKGMLSANGGAAVKLVLAAFLRLGYRARYELVNMAEHGVPQTRQRVIFVGVRLDQWRGEFRFPPKTHRLRDDKKALRWLPEAVSLVQAIGDLPAPGEELLGSMYGDSVLLNTKTGDWRHKRSNYSHPDPRDKTQPCVTQISSGGAGIVVIRSAGNYPVVNADVLAGSIGENGRQLVRRANGKQYKADRIRPTVTIDEPSQTATSAGALHVFGKTGVDSMRRMTVRECARVQSFPDWYEFQGSQADGYRQVGNAVPPLYAKRLALALIEYDKREPI